MLVLLVFEHTDASFCSFFSFSILVDDDDRDMHGLGTDICVAEWPILALNFMGGLWLPPFATPSIRSSSCCS